MDAHCMPGAFIERGEVTAAGGGGYKIKSLDRPGIHTPEISATGETAYAVGDRVYFFLFRDGTGKILCGME